MTPPTAPTLDLTRMPLEPAAALLRRVGEALLTALLNREPAPSLAQLVGRAELPLLLPYAWGRHALPLRQSLIRPWLRQLWWWWMPLRRKAWAPPPVLPSLQRSLQRAIQRPITPDRWGELAAIWVDRSVGGIDRRWLAAPFWPLAGELAWGDTAYLTNTSRLIRRTLAQRVIFFPGPPPVPALAAPTYWTLIALAEVGQPTPWPPLPRRRVIIAGLRRLQAIGTRITLAPGWAGCWDQWIITEALRLWPNASEQAVAAPLRSALAALPIHHHLGNALSAEPAAALAAPGWEQQLPPWLGDLARWDREERIDHV